MDKRVVKSVGDIDTGGPGGQAILVAVQTYDDGSTDTVPQRPANDPQGFVLASETHANEIAERKKTHGF
jgi:hypothetical protein